MKKKSLLYSFLVSVILTISSIPLSLRAQNELPQVFSPNAAEIGKYGKIPVSYFNGLPNISIPLTELKAMNYTLPIYLTYHASGNKPDQHPGWVGLGWTLHAGGCINRVIHGLTDEIDEDELLGIYDDSALSPPDYLSHAHTFQTTSINTDTLDTALYHPSYDLNPDEFQVNFPGLNSSFYLTGADTAKIASAEGVDYSVSVLVEPFVPVDVYENERLFTANQHTYISTIIITTGDGTVYKFGGVDEAIEFNYQIDPAPATVKKLKRIPNTWNITSILFPNGEEIIFEYVKEGIPIITLDRHHYESCLYDPRNPDSPQGYVVNTRMDAGAYLNINYILLSPSYLHRIRAKKTGEEVSFSISPSIEKEDIVNINLFQNKVASPLDHFPLQKCLSQNIYQKLDRIESPHDTISFGYTSSSLERLKLLSVSFNSGPVKRYGMKYNTLPLPDYHSRHLDSWGYYSQSTILDGDGPYYQADENAMKAEILESLQYPTGGKTQFEYEAHRYGRIARQYPFELESSSGMVGGLRIKRMKDITDNEEIVREYLYQDGSGESSGILADKPRFEADGTLSLGMSGYHGWAAPLVYVNIDSVTWAAPYHLSGERMLNQLPLTQGCHVTYSRVEERYPGSGRTIFHYSNHDDTPDEPYILGYSNYEDCGLYNSFSSNSLARGLLLRKETYTQGCTSPKVVEVMDYARDTTDYVQGIDQIVQCREILRRVALIRYYTYFPGLVKKTVTLYPDGGGLPFTETTEYTYDSHRRLTGTMRRVGGTVERDTLTYTGNYSVAPYSGMAARNMISYPVEQVRFRKDTLAAEKVIGAELTAWKQSDTLFLPAEKYRANVGSGLTGSFSFFNGNTKDSHYDPNPEEKYVAYDSLGNILLTQNRADYWTSYTWTPDGCHPAAVIPGAKQEYKQKVTADVSRVKIFQQDPDDVQSLTFTCMSSFILRIWLTCPNNQCWDVTPVVDGTHYRIVCVNDPSAPNPWPANASSYPSPLEIPVTAGTHTVRLLGGYHSYTVNSTDPGQYTIELNYKEMQETEQPVPGHTVVFEDFEEDGNYTLGGFQSERGHVGTWSHSLYVPGGPYIVDFRVFRNGKWNYVRQSTSNYVVVINEGSAPIDHVRIFPVSSLPESFTWNKDGTLRSRTDSRGITQSYRYDGLGRLVGVYDNDGKKVEGYEYNYQNQEDE